MKTRKASLSPRDQAQALMSTYLKQMKAPSAGLWVLGTYGDLLLSAGRAKLQDPTSLGSLASALMGAAEGLGSLMKFSAEPLVMGEGRKIFWMQRVSKNHLVVGLNVAHHPARLKPVITKLKKVLSMSASQSSNEALEGWLNDVVH